MHHQHATQRPRGYGQPTGDVIGQEPTTQEPFGQQAISTQHTQIGDPQAQLTGRDQPGGMQPGPTTGTGESGQFEQSAMGAGYTQPGGQQSVASPPEHVGATLDESLSAPMRMALDDAVASMEVCEWCADQCIDEGPEMSRCIRLCRDVADLARVSATFIARNSIFGPSIARTFADAAQECARECEQHPHDHCQECARVLTRAVQTTEELLATTGVEG